MVNAMAPGSVCRARQRERVCERDRLRERVRGRKRERGRQREREGEAERERVKGRETGWRECVSGQVPGGARPPARSTVRGIRRPPNMAQAKARTWPRLSYLCRIRLTAARVSPTLG